MCGQKCKKFQLIYPATLQQRPPPFPPDTHTHSPQPTTTLTCTKTHKIKTKKQKNKQNINTYSCYRVDLGQIRQHQYHRHFFHRGHLSQKQWARALLGGWEQRSARFKSQLGTLRADWWSNMPCVDCDTAQLFL